MSGRNVIKILNSNIISEVDGTWLASEIFYEKCSPSYNEHTMVPDFLETYLDEMMGRWKSVIVAGTGNEGNAAGHTAVTLQEGVQTEIQFGVAAGEAGLNVQLWKNYTDQFDIYLRAPDGTQIGPLYENMGPQRYRIGQTNLLIYYGKPSPFMISQEIFFDFIPVNVYVTAGVWRIILEPRRLTDGNVDLWLPSAGTSEPCNPFSTDRQQRIP